MVSGVLLLSLGSNSNCSSNLALTEAIYVTALRMVSGVLLLDELQLNLSPGTPLRSPGTQSKFCHEEIRRSN